MNLLWLFLLIGGISWGLTGLLYRYALNTNLMDMPNERSSHSVSTPRGGGVASVISFQFGMVILWSMSLLDTMPFIGILGAGFLVAIVGFIDDHGHVAARWRLLTHFGAAGWLLYWLSGLSPLLVPGSEYDLGWAGYLLLAIGLVWLLNLYNFMDGIDGLAGIEALSSSLVVGLLCLLVFDEKNLSSLHFLMSASVVGFLLWNFPPAKIFMGDSGSGFIGFILGALTIYSAHISQQIFWVWLIMLGVFIVDATYTLLRRLLQGDNVCKAHRSHAYQYASRKYGSHLRVTLSVLMINLCWLAPWAIAVSYGIIDGSLAVLCAYTPLLWLAWYFHAGEMEIKI